MIEKTIKSESLFTGRVLSLKKDTVLLPTGVQSTREIITHKPVVTILPFEAPDTIYLIKQYRHAVGKILIEAPAGIMETEEKPLDSASRELEEETGFTAENWTLLTEYYPAPGFCDEYMYVYLARQLTRTQTHFDDDEIIELCPHTISQVNEMIKNNEIIDGKTILAFQMAKPYFN